MPSKKSFIGNRRLGFYSDKYSVCIYILVKTWPQVQYVNKTKAKPSALMASRQHTECFILHITKARR